MAVSDSDVNDEGPRLARAYAVLDPDGAATQIDGWYVGGDLFRIEIPGLDSGTLTLELCAEDPMGNVGCSVAQAIDFGAGPGDGDGDSGDGDGDPGDGDGDGDPGDGDGDPTAGDGDGDSGESGETGPGATDSAEGDGCACAQTSPRGIFAGATPAWANLAWTCLALLGVGAVRRRRQDA
jgi:hypothetical protein